MIHLRNKRFGDKLTYEDAIKLFPDLTITEFTNAGGFYVNSENNETNKEITDVQQVKKPTKQKSNK